MRGDLVTVAGGADYAGKPRPAVIVQNSLADTGSFTVCLMTAADSGAPLVRLPVAPSAENGLREPSFVMVDRITTLPARKVSKPFGRLSDTDMLRINAALVVFLGIEGTSTR